MIAAVALSLCCVDTLHHYTIILEDPKTVPLMTEGGAGGGDIEGGQKGEEE